MENRYKELVFEAEEGIKIETEEGKNGELIIKAKHILAKDAVNDEQNKNYEDPPIPTGYIHKFGEWNNGFVIERINDGSQFVWVPVGFLKPNGLSSEYCCEEVFGRRRYGNHHIFSDEYYNESVEGELLNQYHSVKKYGGFYISRYNISMSGDGKPQSIKGVIPCVNIDFYDAKKIAASMEKSEEINSHLTYGAEYDSVLEWFLDSNAKSYCEIAGDSTEWGNYWNGNYSPRRVVETGSREEWMVNNIYDFAGNVDEWTQEKYNEFGRRVVRGGDCKRSGNIYPVSSRNYQIPSIIGKTTGFRVVLFIK